MLRGECGVLTQKWLPYQYLLVPMGACWAESVGAAGPAAGVARERFKRWFWCSSFSSTYEFAASSQAARDFNELRGWAASGSSPQPVTEFSFDAARLGEITPKQQSIYKAVMALVLRNGALDFHKGRPLTPATIAADGVDDHHVFPQAHLRGRGIAGQIVDCVLNRTMIDAETNRRIGKRSPSDYLVEIRTAFEKEPAADFQRLLDSHLLPSDQDSALMSDDFDEFLTWRRQRIAADIERATGSVTTGAGKQGDDQAA
jgi:hypothetical protein